MSTPLPRDQFPVADRYRYLDHAGIAAPPTVVAHAVARDASAGTMLGSMGADRRAEHLVGLGATVVSDRSAEGRSAIVTATFGDADPAELTERLITYGVVVSDRGDAVRFAPHGWNDDEDLHATLKAIRRAWRR